jgi:hypothetical protein
MLALEGRIEEFSVGEIIQVVAMGRKTGTLVIEGAVEQVSIYFLEGKAVYANPVYQREHLGNILVKQGVVARGDVNKALARQRELNGLGERVRVGSILVSMGVLTKEQLSKYITEQITESLYLIMNEKSGTFKFLPDMDVSSQDIFIELNIEKAILEGTRLIDEWGMIREKLVDFNDVYAVNTELPDGDPIRLTVEEWKILSLLDGRRSVNDIIEIAERSRFEVCKVLFDFVCFDLVRKVEGEAKEESK